jgi:hypothetical protein
VKNVQRRIEVSWPNGRTGILMIGAAERWLPFYANIVTDRTVTSLSVDSKFIYRSLLEAVLPYLAGEQDQPPVPMAELMESELCALAAKKSWENGDIEVRLDQLAGSSVSYDGRIFAEEYRASR